MKSYILSAALVLLGLISSASIDAYAQEQEPQDLDLMAEQEADRLAGLLDLDGWQVFYVDSTLKVNFNAMQAEFDQLQKSKVSNADIYLEVRDKYWDIIDADYMKWFTPEQWQAYLKSGAAKLQKQRAKRKAKRQ